MIAGILVGNIVVASLTWAAEPSRIGDTVRDRFELAGKTVPLPGGSWVLAGLALGTAAEGDKAPAPVMDAVLLQVAGNQVEAFVLVHTSLLPAENGWGMTRDCARTDLYEARVVRDGRRDVACLFVGPAVTVTAGDTAASRAWTSARAMVEDHGWLVPTRWIVAGVSVADREDMLDARYAFALDPDAPPPGPGVNDPWSPAALGMAHAEPGMADAVDDWAEWATGWRFLTDRPPTLPPDAQARADRIAGIVQWLDEKARPAIENGLAGQAAATALPVPWPYPPSDDPDAPVAPDRTLRMDRLAGVLADGSMTAAEAVVFAPQFEDPAAPIETFRWTDLPPWELSAIKLATWKVISTTKSLIVKYLFVGDIQLVAMMQLATSAWGTVRYYFNDLFWNMVTGQGSEDKTKAKPLDFAGAVVFGGG